MIRRFFCLTALAILPMVLPQAHAQANWPNKPVRVIVNAAAGSGADVSARIFAESFSKTFGQPFVLDFRPGANGILGTDLAAKSPGDGYTLLFTYTAAHVVNPALYDKLPYDTVKDFAPIQQIGAGGNVLVVSPSLPVKDLAEFIAYVKSKPADSLSYGSWGNGSGGHLSMEALKQHAGIRIKHIPYKGAPAALNDVMAGHIEAAFTSTAGGLPLIQSGKLRPLAISGPYRVPAIPEVRTMSEQGVPFDVTAGYMFVAPAGTPAAIISRLNQEINRLLVAPEMAASLKRIGLPEFPIKTPEQFAEAIKVDLKVWAEIVRNGNIKPD